MKRPMEFHHATQPAALTRGEFLYAAALAGGAALVCLVGCAGNHALVAWEQIPPRSEDPRLQAIAVALLAPSPHNKQPWLVALSGNDTLELRIDTQRTMPFADPYYRQIYISEGAFLELLIIALQGLGYQPEVTLFPGAGSKESLPLTAPIARVRLGRTGSLADPLGKFVSERRSNKRPYDRDNVPASSVLSSFVAAQRGNPNVDCGVTVERATVAAISKLAHQAVALDTSDAKRYAEMVEMFRFDNEERERYRDGFGLAQSGISGFKRWMAESFFISRNSARSPTSDFAKEGIELAKKQVEGTPAWGWIVTPGNTRGDQVTAGRIYARGSLQAARLGLAQHPMSQLLQEIGGMAELRQALYAWLQVSRDATVQMLFRLGYAKAVEHSPRRSSETLLVQT